MVVEEEPLEADENLQENWMREQEKQMLLGVVEQRERPANHLVAMVDEFEFHTTLVLVKEDEEVQQQKAEEAVINLDQELEEEVVEVVVMAVVVGEVEHDAYSELLSVKVVHSAEQLS